LNAPPLAICLVYDRLYPVSVGGAERWYRLLAERLSQQGYRVTYVTSEHWEAGHAPAIPGVRIVALRSQGDLYYRERRRALPLLTFGLAVGWHLYRHGRDYDLVHTSAMLNATALIAGCLAPLRGYRLILDWWEVWTRHYWREYLGSIAGSAGWFLQRRVAHLRHQPIAYSRLHADRLRRFRHGDEIPILRGLLDENWAVDKPIPAAPLVASAGRLISEKQTAAIPPALAIAREQLPELRAVIYGAGPNANRVRQAIGAAGLHSVIDLPGFVSEEELRDTLRRALCLVLLSRREGFGLIVAEAAALGVPSVVLRHPDSAASELIVEGVNGFLCDSTNAAEVAATILRVHEAGPALRRRTLGWFQTHADALTAGGTIARLGALYRDAAPEGSSVR
jgi:glycosyltransferase involved in cell wall biosynthesis